MPSNRTVLLLATVLSGCGGARASQDAETAAPPPETPAPTAPGYGQPAPGAAPGYDQPNLQPERHEREASTVEEALQQLRADELSLDQAMTADGLSTFQCDRACRALTSMERSVVRLCELAGEADGRCVSSRERLDKATTRVSDAGCRCP